MHEIKFRVWIPDEHYLTYDPGEFYLTAEGEIMDVNTDLPFKGNPVLMQFTGLKDKNNVQIFEGDVVNCVSEMDSANMVVIFEDGEFRMVLCEEFRDYQTGCGFYAIRCFDKEVIGNIYENPDLMKEGKAE